MAREDDPPAVDFQSVQAHYDLSDDFFSLFLDPSLTYSCAYFPTGRESLEDAQRAKIDLALGKLQIADGDLLLDVGCGWGSAVARARTSYKARVVGLTLSRNQHAYAAGRFASDPQVEIRLRDGRPIRGPATRSSRLGRSSTSPQRSTMHSSHVAIRCLLPMGACSSRP